MVDFLSNIVSHKKEEVAAAQREKPMAALRNQAAASRSRRPFFDALKEPGPSGVNIIAEIKRASPSRGPLCPGLNPAAMAAQYEAGGAAALSVLTDETFFKGNLSDLQSARGACTLPVLRKDFILSSYQIYESAAAGADAVLLIVRVLNRRQLTDYLALCRELSLDALVEVHAADELEIANAAGARLVGINNRNLASFDTDIGHAISLVRRLGPNQVPVAASGITGRADIQKNLSAGIFDFLVGESLVKSADPVATLQVLQGKPS
jgi:indole-3-glycerol phosphate synthase